MDYTRMTKRQLIERLEGLDRRLDTHQRKRSEEARHIPDDSPYEILAENITDGILIMDLEGKILFATPATLRMFGLQRADDFIGTNLLDYAAPDYLDKATRDKEEVVRGRGGFLSVYKGVAKNGREIWVEGFGIIVPFRGEKASLIGLRDITERIKAEEQLRGFETKYRAILDAIQEAYYETDLAGTITFVNEGGNRIMGYSPEELLGMAYHEYMSPETAERLHSVFNTTYQTGRPSEINNYEIITKDGTTKNLNTRVFLIRDSAGNRIGFRGISRDVTEQVRAERALRESEERYRTILEDINEAYFETNLAGEITFVNDVACKMSGYTRGELFDMKSREYASPASLKRITDVFKRVYQTGVPGEMGDYEIRIKNGSTRIRTMHISLVRDSEGSPVGFRGISRDVTERRRAEQALQESEERYRNLFEKTASPIIITNPEGRFIDWNRAALSFLECTPEELLERNIHDFLPLEAQEEVADREKDYWRRSRTVEARYLIRGSIKILELSMTPAVLNGRDVVFGVGKDITERKQAEEKLAYLATHDQLTGLPNRALFSDRLALEIEKSRRNDKMLAVILFDLDRFKEVNDTLGHGVGDLLLTELGHRLKGCLRKSDTVARMGGDEFFVLLCDIKDEEDAEIISGKILEVIRRPFVLESSEIHITASLGIAFFPKDGDDVETLTKKADVAMYRSKGVDRSHHRDYTRGN